MRKAPHIIISFLLATCLIMVTCSVVHAQGGGKAAYNYSKQNHSKQNHKAPDRRNHGNGPVTSTRTRGDVVESLNKKYPGKVLSVKRVERLGPNIYRVKILSKDGRVRSILVDGVTGNAFQGKKK